MSKHQAAAHTASGGERVLHRQRPSVRARFIQPVVIKQGGLFLLSTQTGDIQVDSDQGLYFHDMRHLSAHALRLNGQPLVPLLADASEGHMAIFELTNPDLVDESSGAVQVGKESLGIRREKVIGRHCDETITVRNYVREPVEVSLTLSYEVDFVDMFVVRGTPQGKRGKLDQPRWADSTLTFHYAGADGHERTTTLRFSQKPDAHDAGQLTYRLKLQPQQPWVLHVNCEVRDGHAGPLEPTPSESGGAGAEDRKRAKAGSLGAGARVETSNPLFDQVITRSFLDLHMLSMRQQKQTFFAAGVPWYVALFGRDSLLTAMQMAAFEPEIGANTLRVLAHHQGTKVDDWRDEQPGKILHELRVDEMANLDEIPQTPYYGSVDATPIFLVLLGIYSAWTGSLDLFHELHDNVERALAWIEHYGDSDGDGFIDYQTHSKSGGRNQGWKDSGNGIVMEDGQLAEPPIALPEVQGDVYLAWRSAADLYEREGDATTAEGLRGKATALYTAFNQAFWLPGQGYYAFCRQRDGRFSKSIASNGAHALWTGIVDPKHARAVVERVLQPDMFTGWGIRTLSAEDASYNPVDYQVGSVWPHDNALIVAGMQRYGFVHEAGRVFTAITQAATQFEHSRLPEVFAGYDRSLSSRPVQYPVACNPQAWAAGSVPYMLTSVLGLQPDAFQRRLHIQRPCLPDGLGWVALRNLRVGQAEVDVEYQRSGDQTLVAVTRKHGDVSVSVES